MKTIQVACGIRKEYDNGNITFEGGETFNGICYKDIEAWNNNSGIIYISEYELEDITDINDLWTKKSWVKFVHDYIKETLEGENIIIPIGFDNYIAQIVFNECDWCDLSTRLYEIFDYNTILENLREYDKFKDNIIQI